MLGLAQGWEGAGAGGKRGAERVVWLLMLALRIHE